MTKDFIVADLKDARALKARDRQGPVRISGRIIDENGSPVINAYAVAQRSEKIDGIPDFLSAWVEPDGRYILYLQPGKYYIGSATAFPPDQVRFLKEAVTLDSDRSDLDIVGKSRTH